MMILNYKSKKQLKENIGKPLDYTETSRFGNEYMSDGSFIGCNRPYSPEYPKFSQRKGREFFANVTMNKGIISAIDKPNSPYEVVVKDLKRRGKI
jgi:hypothetical protein